MKTYKRTALSIMISGALLSLGSVTLVQASELGKALANGKAFGNFNLRYETAEQDNALDDASAFTLRSRIGYSTGAIGGWSATVEMEDNRIVLGEGDYSVPPAGYNAGIYSVIADPEHTELDQGFIQYKSDNLTAKFGRQVITFDNHRFVGHVGWRQDRQTFDAVSFKYAATKEFSISYAYLDQRNRIFGEEADIDSSDHLLNASYKTPYGTITGYSYLLEDDTPAENVFDSYGVRFAGSAKSGETKILYTAEYATQTRENAAGADFDADYIFVEGGAVISGITAKLGYEVLGSDDGAYGFTTPLATLHKFNGWADVFLGTPAEGLVDLHVTLSGNLAGGKWLVIYHDFEADDSSPTVDDLGSELDLQYTKAIDKNFSFGLKYAAYSGEGGRVDTDRFWAWLTAKF